LQQQWQNDCDRLIKPHLQWEFKNLGKGEWEKIKDALDCETINKAFELGREFRRIDSLGLPFDLEDAVNGGKIEIYMPDESGYKWETAIKFAVFNVDTNRFAAMFNDNWQIVGVLDSDKELLRMKESRLKTTGVKS
jgi:hypothetical protein